MESIFFSDLIDPLIKLIPVFAVFKVKQVFLPTRMCRQEVRETPIRRTRILRLKVFRNNFMAVLKSV